MARAKHYSYNQPVFATKASIPELCDTNPTVKNVLDAFPKIRTRGDYLAAWDGEMIPKSRYTSTIRNANIGGFNNHFQGIQRLRKGGYLVISGGDAHGKASHLFVIKMESRREKGVWRSNLIESCNPPDDDKMVKIIGINQNSEINRRLGIDNSYWHAGGMSTLGDILAVPLEGKEAGCPSSKILFYHMAEPENPLPFPFCINRCGVKAGAVALTKLSNGYYLVAVWTDSDDHRSDKGLRRHLDFYLSLSTNFFDGFGEKFLTWDPEDVQPNEDNGQEGNFSDFQSINFINGHDSSLYLVGLHNTSDFEPISPWGRDYADLYSVNFDCDLHPDKVYNDALNVIITKERNKHFYCQDRQCNMDAGASIYISLSGTMMVYACYYWVQYGRIKFNEYRPDPDFFTPPTITKIDDAWIELFEDKGFRGRRLSLGGKEGTKIRDYRKIFVQGDSFNDKVSSVRFQIPEGKTYRLYEHRNYRGDRLDLKGTGKAEKIEDFKKRGFCDEVSSSCYKS